MADKPTYWELQVCNAAEYAIDTIYHAIVESLAGQFTCGEIEAIANLYETMCHTASAKNILEAHAAYDEPGDLHHA